jgi:quercetin dioxygenase-like cupin family protein
MLRIKTRPDDGHVQVGVFESEMPPGGGFPLAHIHNSWEEVFYVLEGEMEYRLGDDWLPAAAGSTICIPPGVVHAFRNASDQPARHLVVHAPAVAVEAIEQMAQTPRDQWAELFVKYDSRLLDP